MLFFQQQMPGHEHSCHRDILLCRRINSGTNWSRVRSMPYHAARIDGPSYVQFQLCKEIMDAKPCSYGDNCTFAQVTYWLVIPHLYDLCFSPTSNSTSGTPKSEASLCVLGSPTTGHLLTLFLISKEFSGKSSHPRIPTICF